MVGLYLCLYMCMCVSLIVTNPLHHHHHIYYYYCHQGLTFWDLGERGVMHMFGNFERVLQKGLHSYLDVSGSPIEGV